MIKTSILFLLASTILLLTISNQHGVNAAPNGSFLSLLGKKNDGQCEECKKGIENISETIQQIGISYKDYLCNAFCLLMKGHEKECQNYINKNYAEFSAKIQKEFSNPEQICQKAGLCGGNNDSRQMMGQKGINNFVDLIKFVKIDNKKQDENVCEKCMGQIELFEHAFSIYIPKIVKYIENTICQYIGEHKNECQKSVNEYGQKVLDEILQIFNSKRFCQNIGIC